MFVTVCFIAVADDYSSVNNIRIGEFNVTIPLPMNYNTSKIAKAIFIYKFFL